MALSKLFKPQGMFRAPEDAVPLHSRDYNTLVDEINVKAPTASPTFTGTATLPDVVMSGHKNGQVFLANAFQYPAPATEWVASQWGAWLAASKTDDYIYLPLNFLKIGDEIVSYKLLGDVTEAAAAILDCKLVKISASDPVSSSDPAGGAIGQITSDGAFDVLATLTAPEVVATDKQYLLLIKGTTGVGDTIVVTGAEVVINRK